MQLIEHAHTAYNDIDVWDTGHGYEFQVIGATHASYHRRRLMTGHAWDAITAAALLHPDEAPNDILMLGLAGGTALRQLRHFLPYARITAVEIDAEIVALARKYMAIDELELDIVIDDAYQFIKKRRAAFDMVVDDIYLSGAKDVVRPQALEIEVIEHLRAQARPTGIVCANLVTGAGHRKVQTAARESFTHAFKQVRMVTPPDSYNHTLVGGDQLAKPRRIKDLAQRLTNTYDQRKWLELRTTRVK